MTDSLRTPDRHQRGAAHRLVTMLVWLLPPCRIKNHLLNLLGNRIHPTATIWPSLVISCGVFDLAEFTVIMPGNLFRQMNRVELDTCAYIGTLNQFVADRDYWTFESRAGVLRLGELCGITNRHQLDCSGRIELHPRSAIGGIRSIFESRALDLESNRILLGKIVVGEYSLTASACIVQSGARIPPKSLVALGSVVVSRDEDDDATSGLYAGSAASRRGDLPDCAWWYRDLRDTRPQGPHDFDFDIPRA